MPPCVPRVSVESPCDNPELAVGGRFANRINWTLRHGGCPAPDDVAGYRVYYAPTTALAWELIHQSSDPNQLSFEHGSVTGFAGCYAVSALDSLDNESDLSNVVCIENCPFYSLPNVFTPNGDGHNDVFRPFPYRFIERVDFKVYNRWGQLVFETTNPDLDWNGSNLDGKELSQGVYHYVCQVFEVDVDGMQRVPNLLTGFIELIR